MTPPVEARDMLCWGIFREPAHSPGRESDDALILRATAKRLEDRGFRVELRGPDELDAAGDRRPRAVFLMCERLPVLRELAAWEARGVPHVNRPAGVLNTYRERMVATLAAADVPFVESRVVPTGASDVPGPLPVWVKRADVHNTQEGDVVLAPTSAARAAALAGLAARGLPRAVLQPHVEGDLVKFYGIGTDGATVEGGPPWFRWFYHADQQLHEYPFDVAGVGRLVRRAAAALGLEVYGGDVIVTPSGEPVLLDINAWPSFARVRDAAAEAIAAHLAARFAGAAR